MVDLRIRHIEFDSGLLAEKVGQLELPSSASEPSLADRVRTSARDAGFHLVAYKSQQPFALRGFEAVGSLREFTAEPRAVLQKLPPVGDAVIRPIEPGDWPAVAALLTDTPPTRFGNDRRLTRAQVIEHKLALLQEYARREPTLAIVAEVGDGSIGGFQVSRISNDEFDFYELCVAPRYRRGLLATRLLRTNLERLLKLRPQAERIITHIYDDNETSIRFFTRLGFTATGESEHWYHGWFDLPEEHDMQQKIVEFISNTLLVEFDENVTLDSDLFELGAVDSYGYVELIAFLEGEFGIQISDEELYSNSLTSVSQMVALVESKQTKRAA